MTRKRTDLWSQVEKLIARVGAIAGGILALGGVGGRLLDLSIEILMSATAIIVVVGVYLAVERPSTRPWSLIVPVGSIIGLALAATLRPPPPQPPPGGLKWVCVDEAQLLSSPAAPDGLTTMLRGETFEVERHSLESGGWWAFGNRTTRGARGWVYSGSLCLAERISLPDESGRSSGSVYDVEVKVESRNPAAALPSDFGLLAPTRVQVCSTCKAGDAGEIHDIPAGARLIFYLDDSTGLCVSEDPAHAEVEKVGGLDWTIRWDDACNQRRGDGNYIDLVVRVSAVR